MFAAVDAYDRYIGRYSPSLAQLVIEAAGIKAGDRVLDVGCGPGALTSALVATVGAEHVTAVDPSPAFLEACRRRNPGIRAEFASGEQLPFEDAAFDATLAQLVVNFMADPHAGVAEMGRVTRPGGVVAAAVWDYGDGMTLLRAFWDAAAEVDPAAGATDERHMRFATTDELADLLRRAHLTDVVVTAGVVPAAYESFDDLWQPIEAGVGPAGAYAASLEPAARASLKAALERRLAPQPGAFELTARAWIATGRVGRTAV